MIKIFKIIQNLNKIEYDEISVDVQVNGGYCPCLDFKNKDSLCMCKEFREQISEGFCRCGRYQKVLI